MIDTHKISQAFHSRHECGQPIAFHRHQDAYAAVVLDGTYLEASSDGLWLCEPGTVVVHPLLHAHANWFPNSSAHVLNIPLPAGSETAREYVVFRTSARAPRVCDPVP